MTTAHRRTSDPRQRAFGSYREYKATGIHWLGEIPAHWEMKRLKTIATVRLSNVDKHSVPSQVSVRLCNYVDVYYNDEITEGREYMNATATPEQLRRYSLQAGDVLITKDSETWNDIAVPAVVVEDLANVVCGYHLAHVRPGPRVNGRFLARQFAAIGLRDQFHVAANGITRYGLSGDSIRSGVFPVPPIREQHAIGKFLDRETARIDALVARKERLIGLLQEKRAALITRAVTRGLDTDVPLKDSGVEWLGDIPAHWKAERVKWLARMESGHTPDRKADAYWTDGDIPWVSLNDTHHLKHHDYIAATEFYTNEYGLANSSARLLPSRSVVFSRDATVGLCAITELPMAVSQHFIAWICGEDLVAEYLLRVLDAMQHELERLTMGATLRTMGLPEVKSLVTPVPPVHEQEAIVSHIQKECRCLDRLVGKVREAIDHLTEYRTALICAAVTGKIDVREL